MSIADTLRRAGPYATNGVQTTFSFAFKVFEAGDLLVTLTDGGVDTEAALGTDYTVVLYTDQNTTPGGNVTMAVAPNGPTITITSAMPIEQPATFTNTGGFYPRVLDDSLDRLTIIQQQQAELLTRTPVAPVGGGTPGYFPVLNAEGGFDYTEGVGGADAALRNDLASGTGSLIGLGPGRSLAGLVSHLDVYAEDFGAVADGVVNDTTALQAAIDAAVAYGVRRLNLLSNTYLTRSLTIPSDFELIGANGAMLKRDPAWTGNNNVILQIGGTAADVRRVTVDGVRFDLNGAGPFGRIIQLGQQDVSVTLRTVAAIRLLNLELLDTAPVHTTGDKWAILWRGNVEDVRIENNYCNGEMQLAAGGSDLYRSIHITGNRVVAGYANGIAMSTGRDNHVVDGLFITNNYVEATALSIFLGPDSIYAANTGGEWKNVHVEGNTCVTRDDGSQTSWMGIYLTATQASYTNVSVSGNTVQCRDAMNSQVGIRFDDALSYGTYIRNVACDGNTITGCRWGVQGVALGKSAFTGNVLDACGDGVQIDDTDEQVSLTGNNITGGARGVYLKSGDFLLTGNICPGGPGQIDNTNGRLTLDPGVGETCKVVAVGNAFTDGSPGPGNNFGIYSGATGTIELHLHSNDLSGNDAPMSNTTPTTASKNVGYKTSAHGTTGSIATGADIAHGLNVTPDFVALTPTATGPTNIFVSNIGASTFRVNYTGAGPYTFMWEAKAASDQ